MHLIVFLLSPSGCYVVREREGVAAAKLVTRHIARHTPVQEQSGSPSQLQRLAELCFNCAADILGASQEATAAFPR